MDKTENYGGCPDTSGNLISYDDNGNMTSHEDKGVVNIQYNYLNLPENIKFNATYLIRNPATGEDETRNVITEYIYRADGTKLRKKYTIYATKFKSERATTTDYLDSFQYTINYLGAVFLDFVPTSEGYYDFKKNKYIYSYTDHLGNIRLSYFRNTTSGSAEVLEENNYYAFGMRQDINILSASNSSYKYQYNGKELQTETGWNDYGARMYMSDIGRWGVIDPLAEQMRRYSPYNYAFNNPVMFIDPDGRKPHNPLEFYGPNSAFNLEFDPLTSLYGTPFNDVGRSPYLRSSLPNQWYYGGSGDIGGSDPTPKSSTGTGLIGILSNFFSKLFGTSKKDAQISTFLQGATISRAWTLEVGELTSAGASSLEGFGTGVISVGGATLGALLIPTMIKEPEFNWTRQYDIPVDVPVTTTDSKPEQRITLFRGVHGKHPDLANAYMGMAIPWGGPFSALDHNRGHNNSMFTSWTTSIDVANYSASRRGPGGIILKQSFPVSRLSFFDRHNEGEVQVFGPVYGAQTITPWNGGTWTPYIK